MHDDVQPDRRPFVGYIGGPALRSMEHWRRPQAPCTWAIAAQGFVLDEISGVDHREAELVSLARDNDWYRPGGGTALDDVGRIVEHYGIRVEGIRVEQDHDVPADRLVTALAAGERVLVAVGTEEMEHPDGYDAADPLDHFPGIPGQHPVHTVQVIGVDATDQEHPTVLLNDPSRPDGQGLAVPMYAFLVAWACSGWFIVTAGDR